MENIALSVSKSITELLEHNEKRFLALQMQQDENIKSIEKCKEQSDALEKKCQDLTDENLALRETIEAMQKNESESIINQMNIRSELDKIHKSVTDLEPWVQIMNAISSQLNNLTEFRNTLEAEMKDIHSNQIDLHKNMENQQKQINLCLAAKSTNSFTTKPNISKHTYCSPYNGNRLQTRSPSTSSFFSNNFHNMPMSQHSNHRSTPNHHRLRDDFPGSSDPNCELSEISHDAESLMEGVNALEEFHRNLEKNSICSED